MANLVLKAGKERSLQRRHPWVYATAVAKLQGNAQRGDTVKVLGAKGEFLAWAAYSPDSQLRARVWTFDSSAVVDRNFFEKRLRAAIAARAHLRPRTDAIRLVFGEADGLPGLVVDQYGPLLVVQLLSAGADFWRATLVDLLAQMTGCASIYERSDAAVRNREGLPERTGWLHGPAPDFNIKPDHTTALVVQEDGVRYHIDFMTGHKTGFYIDQRDNRRLVKELCARLLDLNPGKNLRVLNCFSYTGGFSLAAAQAAQAKQAEVDVVSVDSSAEALALARVNARANGLFSERFQTIQANVFEFLNEEFKRLGQQPGYDLIILDPPKFAPSAHHLDKAARAYKDLNMRGLRLLKQGGYLLTFSCSGAMSVDLFQKVVAGAVIDSQIDVQLAQRLAAGSDHPMTMTHPEGEYLKGLLLYRT